MEPCQPRSERGHLVLLAVEERGDQASLRRGGLGRRSRFGWFSGFAGREVVQDVLGGSGQHGIRA